MAAKRKYNSLHEFMEAERKKEEENATTTRTATKTERTYNSLHDFMEADQNGTLNFDDEDDIAPVKGGDKDSIFKSGGFSDGVDGVGDFLGDLGETALGTVGDVLLGVGRGVGRLVEGVVDLGAYGAAGVAGLFGADEAKENIKGWAKRNQVNELTQDAVDYVDQYSVLGNKADMVTEGLGQVGAIILTGGAAGAAGLGTLGATALTTGVTGLSGMGSGMSEAYEQGATDEEAFTYGLISGTAEAATELLFGGLGKASKAIGIGKSAVPLDDLLAKKVTSKFSSQIAKNFTEYGIKASAEGTEEVLSGILQAVGKKATYMDEKEFNEILQDENLLEQFVVGAVTSGIAQSGVVPGMKAGSLREANKTGRDFITGYTKSDQTIIDKEVASRVAEKEKNGKKLTKSEIGKIEEQVQSDLEKGYISIDTIESTFGGNSYTDWKNEVDNNKKLKAELDELRKIPKGEMNDIQTDRLAELKGMNLDDTTKRDGLRKQLDDILKPQLEYSVLQESYNEKARRGQSFEADLTKIDEKQRATYERAINSGVLNNTNRSKEFVNVLAKIEADKGITFDFANNDKLKESGFAVEGKTVNGFAKDGAVTLNVEAAKSWQTVVGHEITHVLEGTEAYNGLREALYAYAESKGELEGRKANLTELYKDMNADIDAELTADLVGDYLFSDNDFIKHLTGNENVFKRVYNEIKYLCKVATGKQLTEVERVKREFDKVWKEYNSNKKGSSVSQSKGIGDVAFSVSANTIDSIIEKYKDKTDYLFVAERKNGTISIDNMVVKKEYRNQGVGTEILNDIISYADTNGKTITLTPTTEFGTKAKLTKWYKQNGFVENKGKNADYTLSDTMYRLPKENVQYSISKDTNGNELSIAVQKRFSNSKAVDENGDLKVLYHGTYNGEFYTFDKSKGSVEGDFGSGFYFTDNESDVENNYEGGGADFENKVARRAEQIEAEEDIDYSEAEQRARKELYVGSNKHEVYLNIENPAIVGETNLLDYESFAEEYDRNDYDSDEDYEGDVEQLITDQIDQIIWDVDRNVDVYNTDGLAEVLWNAVNEGGIDIEQLKANINNLYLEDSNGNLVGNEVTRQVIESLGYDGIIDNTVSQKFNMGLSEDTTHYIVFKPNQIKSITNENPTDNPDIRYSLSADSEGNALTVEQQNKFENSKVRDADGNLLTLYHGSESNAFTEFNMENGVWLTPDQRYSEVYAGKWHSWRDDVPELAYPRSDINGLEPEVYTDPDYRVYKVYADIQNPLNIGEVDGYLSDGKIGALARELGVRYSELNAIASKYMEEPTYRLTRSKEFIELAKSKGFDGLKATESGKETWCVIQSADQIKLTTNKTPTTNPDVRYSISKEGETSPFGTPMNEMYYAKETAADDIAPVAENAPKVEAPMQTNDEMFADTYSEDFEKEMSQMDRNGFINSVGDDIPQRRYQETESLRDSATLDEKALNQITKEVNRFIGLNGAAKKELKAVIQEYSQNANKTQNELFETLYYRFGTQYETSIRDDIASAKRDIREKEIYVSPLEKSEFGSAKDYRAWANRYRNKLKIRSNGVTVDVAYQDLNSEYPHLFPEDILTTQDRLLRIAEVADESPKELLATRIPDEVLLDITVSIDGMVSEYHETERMIASEENRVNWEDLAPPPPENDAEFSAPLRSDIAPMTEAEANAVQDAKVKADKTTPKSTRLADGSRGEELLVDSLDNYPMKTVEQKIAEKLRAIEGEIADNRDLRREAEANYNNQIAKLQEKYNAKKKKDTKTAYGILQSISRLERLKASADANFAKRISDLEARVEKMNDPQYHRAMYRQAKMKEHADFAASILGDTSTWVDKKIGLQYSTNTERRNLRDIVRDANGNKDIARADAIDDALNGQYNREEAAKNRELAQTRGKYADLKITKAEDTYIQMLGEFRHNPETTLTQKDIDEYYQEHQGNIDAAKVDKVIEMARKDYDDWLNRVNAELRNQGMKEIPYRQGYFPHFTEPKQNFLQKLLNWKTQDNEIPTSIAGLTETFRPTKSWQSFDKTRYSDETDYSFMKGFDSYSQGVLDWIYHLDTLQKRRAVENHIRFTHSEEGIKQKIKEAYANEEMDANEVQAQIEHILSEAKNPLNNFVQDFTTHTNILAGKKNSLDRAVEQSTNRHIYSVMTNVQNRMSANMVLANVRSALTNFIPITQSWAQVSPLRSLQATKDTIKNAIKDDGLINKSTFLTNRLKPADNLYKTGWDKVLDKAGIMFEVVDNFSSQVIWRSKYNQNISDGMTETEAIQNADQFAENVMAGRSKGNEPTLFNAKNPLVKAFTMFQLEVNNQYGYLFKDAPNDLKAETNHWKFNLAKGYTTAFIGAYVYNELLSKLTGSDAALDPIGIIEDLLNDLGFGDDEEKEPAEVVTNLMDNVVEELPFVGGLFGGGRIPISSALPYSDDGIKGAIEDISEGNWANVGKEMMNPLLNIGLPVGGGQIKKTTQGLGMFSDEHPVTGSYTDSGALRFPVEDTPANRVQAAIFGQYASENAREYFDNGYAPLKEKQIQEYTDVDLPIADYWKYREGLKGLKSNAEKADYINSLDIQDWQKNLLMNNILDRKEDVDMSNYSDYGSFEEFDFAQKYPNKHAFAKSVGGYSAYTEYKETLGDIKADKDEFGDTITGSRKEKVLNYINGLDADYETKLILFKSQYPSDDTYNHEIINYLNEREDISYEEMVSILTELGFTVKGNDIYWD